MRGFTLIEMMIVLAMVGILAAMAVPSIKNYQNPDQDLIEESCY